AAAAKDAEILLFADADTSFSPQCVGAAVALLEERGLDLLSLVSTLTGKRWYELLVQPAAGVELMRQYPLVLANRDKRRRAFANGQFMMFRAKAYRAVGGHESVKQELLEDLALARLMEARGLRAGVFLADGVMTCRMYREWAAFRRGWKRIYTEAASRRARRLARAARGVRLTGTILPLCALSLVVAAVILVPEYLAPWRYGLAGLGCAALGTFLAAVGWAYRVSRAPLWAVPGYVIGAWAVGSLLAEAGKDLRRGTPTTWGGRSYVRENR
ncbi:MAG TPA: glycosyltransferase, partial [Burkholderiales bacterium]|nr:glycosyltransferase [Burkholderiales bacterium]